MSSDTRFQKGQSGNPAGRPKKRRPNISAFDIIFDKRLVVTQAGKERELTIDEALQLQTYQAALNGSRMAIRKVLKMIEKREKALARTDKEPFRPVEQVFEYNADNAREALLILEIIEPEEGEHPRKWLRVVTWATQAALSRPGRKKFSEKEVTDIKFFTLDPAKLRWPRGRLA